MATSNLDWRDKIANKYGSVDNFYKSQDFLGLDPTQQSKLKNYFAPIDEAKNLTQATTFGTPQEEQKYLNQANGGGTTTIPEIKTGTIKPIMPDTNGGSNNGGSNNGGGTNGGDNKQPSAFETVGANTASGFGDYMAQLEDVVGGLSGDIQGMWDKVNSVGDSMNKQFQIQQAKTNQLAKMWQDNFAAQNDLLQEIKSTGNTAYDEMLKNIQKQSTLVENKFADMRNNFSSIAENYKKMQDFTNAATNSGLEKQLRSKGGKSAAAKIANAMGELGMKSNKDMADLQIQLGTAKNNLEAQYLALKNAIMQDTNITDENKRKFGTEITQLMSKFKTNVTQKGEDLTNALYKPVETQIDTLTKAAMERQMTKINDMWLQSPDRRNSLITAFLQQQLGSMAISPDLISQMQNAPDWTSALVILNNELKRQAQSAADAAARANAQSGQSKLETLINLTNK